MTVSLVIAIILAVIAIAIISRGLRIVPQQHAWVVERFGRYRKSLEPGLNIIIPIVDKVAYKFDLRETPIDSEGDKQQAINVSEGDRQQRINIAEGEKEAQVLRAKGEAEAVLTVARATAEALATIGQSLQREGGMDAMKMRVAEDFIERWGGIAKASNVMIVPAEMGDLSKVVCTASKIVDGARASAA